VFIVYRFQCNGSGRRLWESIRTPYLPRCTFTFNINAHVGSHFYVGIILNHLLFLLTSECQILGDTRKCAANTTTCRPEVAALLVFLR
jgi:hypothetical protein